ncbi:MAG: N-acetylmuramoyl-L-alanine amidase [Paludibacteraceae bacterium]|nr:N-acetylmuramoyl-L-alanine amidase [Paludibacteraceae bacterium]
MKSFRRLILFCSLALAAMPAFPISPVQLSDSLEQFARLHINHIGKVRVSSIRQRNLNIDIETNLILSGVGMSKQELNDLYRHISLWVRGDEKGKVNIYSDGHELRELINPYRRLPADNSDTALTWLTANGDWEDDTDGIPDLHGKTIALWPSHGLYHNRTEDAWHWQRARMWGIVEDIYTVKYAELVSRMLENAGAKVIWPRPRIGIDPDATAIGQSGWPRWMEGARYWLEYQHYPSDIWNTANGKNDYNDDMRSRGNWVNYMNDSIGVDLVIALHSDGISLQGDSDIVGTLCIYTDWNDEKRYKLKDGRSRLQSRFMGDFVQSQLAYDIQYTMCPKWSKRELRQANYCETRKPDIPSVILEILSHKNRADMVYGLDPKFQFIAARAIYKGILKYLHAVDNQPYLVQPLPVRNMQIECVDFKNEARFRLIWSPTVDSLETSAAPSSYIVYIRQDGGEWNEGISVDKTHFTFQPNKGVRYDFYVVAVNQGGVSFPSETLSAYLSPVYCPSSDSPLALVVNAFNDVRGPEWFVDTHTAGIVPNTYAIPYGIDRMYLGEQFDYDKAHDWVNDDDCGLGMCHSNYLGQEIVGNTFDYPCLHGKNLQQMDISYVSCNLDALPALGRFKLVDIIFGKQLEWPADLNAQLQRFCHAGGRLLVSGAYLKGEMVRAHNACNNGELILRLDTTLSPAPRFNYYTKPNTHTIQAENVTGLKTYKKAQVVARYADTNMAAALAWIDHLSNGQMSKALLFGLPLESVDNFDTIYKSCIQWLYEEKESADTDRH